ncbi:streptophobe family protein [Streptomyces sp. NPDC007808]|uniref:streptophobe family protein n=1 Tax=Streptomyces sp. NPDC007808 TaxID=3364779 RepID=UPI0036D0893B
MSASRNVETARRDTRLPWGDVLLSAIAAVSWALIGMAGTAALGLHLLEADAASSLGPMTAAVVALGAGGSVTPSGDVSAFGLTGAEATTAIEITPLGVSLAGAVLLAWFFLRSLRRAGVVIAPAELLARAGAVVVLFVAMLGGLAWAGHDVVTIDGGSLGLDDLPGGGGDGGGIEIPGVGDVGGLLPDRIGDLVDAEAAVGFTVDTAPTLLGGAAWSAGVLLIALLASRRTPLPRGWEVLHHAVRPAASALVTVVLVAVAAGLAAAAYAAVGDEHPERIAGAALLGAPNGVWLGIAVGLLVPFDGRATGVLTGLLPYPLDDLLNGGADQPVTLGRLAELDGRVWLLGVAAALMMLLAGVLTAVRTPVESGSRGGGLAGPGAAAAVPVGPVSRSRGVTGAGAGPVGGSEGMRHPGALRFAGRCALRLGAATAAALPLLVLLTGLSVDASLSVLGFDAFDAGVELRGNLGMALLLGAAWGAGAGAVGALLALASGAAGGRAAPAARGAAAAGAGGGASGTAGGHGSPGTAGGHGPTGTAGGHGATGTAGGHGPTGTAGGHGAGGPLGSVGPAGPWDRAGGSGASAYPGPPGPPRPPGPPGPPGPYAPGAPYRPPNPGTNPYLRMPGEQREPQDARPGEGASWREDARRPGTPPTAGQPPSGDQPPFGDRRFSTESPPSSEPPSSELPSGDDVYGAPTVVRPIEPPARSPRPPRRPGKRPSSGAGGDVPPPPPPPPPPPGKPKGR